MTGSNILPFSATQAAPADPMPQTASPCPPYMPLYIGDLRGVTDGWSGDEVGFFLLLLTYQWSMGRLPTEPAALADLARYKPARFRQVWPRVRPLFAEFDGGLAWLPLVKRREGAAAAYAKILKASAEGVAARQGKRRG